MRRQPLRIAQLASAAAFALLVMPAAAQTRADAAKVPDAKPPAMVPLDDTLEPQVTIIKREGATVSVSW